MSSLEPTFAEKGKAAAPKLSGEKTGGKTRTQRSTAQRIRQNSKFFFVGGRKFFVKGVTYGPFQPREGNHLPSPERVRQDLALMREAGINTVRLYHPPPVSFLDACEEAELKAFITIPWEQHVTFLDDRTRRQSIRKRIANAVSNTQGHPAVFAYAIGNEIPCGIVRWYGARKTENFLESLMDTARQVDHHALYTYANYPSTEYLLPPSVDFYCYNVYLHRQSDFEGYLARLQNLAGEKPLIIGEFGMDSLRHSEEEQARACGWHIESVSRMGLAGTILFSWTDEWFTGGHPIEDWKFGLVDAQRKPKKAFYEIKKVFNESTHRLPLKKHPSISVVVCSYNGARTLEACLTSLTQVDYPDYEVILVDDGSTDSTPAISAEFSKQGIKVIRQENLGLSVARNVGMKAARGEIIAYTDSDCMADQDWLYHLAATLAKGDFAGVGGPNVSPPAQNWVQACVASSPGQPSHVLLSDNEAEHLPGCNMAFYKWALESIGGFDPIFRKAGDDVDVCWRLLASGRRLAFSPSAVVWHHRRFSVGAYFKQQAGYGEAEALLRFKHLIYFGPTGSARWHGQVYEGGRFSTFLQPPIVYHGIFGSGLFQCVYSRRSSELVQMMGSLEWAAFTFATLLFAVVMRQGWYVPSGLAACTIGVGLAYGMRARLEAPYRGFFCRLLISLLAILQPLRRGWERYRTWMLKKRTPMEAFGGSRELRAQKITWERHAILSFWSEPPVSAGRNQLLSAIQKKLDQEGWRYSPDTGWTHWDYQIYGNRWWQLHLLTMTEEHGDGKRLTRVRLKPNPTVFARMAGLVVGVISLLAFLKFHYKNTEIGFHSIGLWLNAEEGFRSIGLWFCAVSLGLTFLVLRSARLRRRIAQVVKLAAKDVGLEPLKNKKVS